ncbi:PilC/PilY family type IV pilus protein [Acinetobacter dispersus]|uniref:PilY1 beta-propeller domain-containing protein n=1 Tax=Acinetobacter dispersus TaxID=70348 RepID=N9LCK2_9GAMM|nr:PilC/PilY family type IV pilus protein [Acinetobacter dispersus]ENW93983.1 hypothetical protein F904_00891 [Acinetobacter dispersus]
MKIFNQKLLSATVSMLMTVMVCHVATTQASDIDIYKLPNQSKMTLFLMFDTSGSMGYGNGYSFTSNNGVTMNSTSSLVGDYNICQWVDNGNRANPRYTTPTNTTDSKTFKVGNRAAITYGVNSCNVSASTYNASNEPYKTRIRNECELIGVNAYKCYDRLSRLKIALAQVLSSNEISDSIQIGLGQFSSPTSTTNSSSQDGVSGRVLYPVVPLTEANREILINKMVGLAAWSGTPSAAAYGESGAYFLGKNTYNLSNSGYSYSDTTSRNNNSGYKPPVTTADLADTCNGQGIYFLTDGIANSSTATYTKAIMNKSVSLSGTGLSGGNDEAGWTEIGQFAKLLRSGNNIKTAVVGFGSDFPNGSTFVKDLSVDILDQDGAIVETVNRRFYDCSKLPDPNLGVNSADKIYRQDVRNTCNWGAKQHKDLPNSVGGFGSGGFYSAQSAADIVDSIKYFIEDIKPRFKPIATGSPTLPVDALNPIQIQPYGYYASFTPKPQEPYQLWLGNLNKYHIKDGQLYDTTKTIRLIQDSGKLNTSANGIWNGGVLGKLPLGTFTETTSSNRTVFTNRQINTANVAEEATALQKVNLTTLFNTGTDGTLKSDPKKNYWLNILGYKVAENATGLTVATLPVDIQRQLGATMHSKPILLTQGGKIVASTVGNNQAEVTSIDRKDYLLFGSNQGSLHVVEVGTDTDTDRGKEVFTFVPHEMMEKQPKAFLNEGATNGGRANLYYGMDGAWTAYTQYVSKTDKTLTVGTSGRKDNDGKDLNQKGLQWVYGGLRMGGRGYYALDLTEISSPTLKFHINPDDAVIKENGIPKLDASGKKIPDTNNPLHYMGQSWSKPTIAWVNWGGVRKLVMFVGGGYDEGYEAPDYDQDNNITTPKRGAGVYMFDAGNGELLWWASANVKSGMSGTGVKDDNLKYSVVSQINAVDRNGDGTVDHLYFGDLGGQAFRIDLDNKKDTATSAFAKRIVRLYDAHVAGGISPRFYEMPSFSIHSGIDGLFGVVALSSGNRSSPLVGGAATNRTSTATANDAVYVIYDNDVARSDLYSIANDKLRTSATNSGVSLTLITSGNFSTLKDGIAQKTGANYTGGWKYQYDTTAGKYKGMNEIYALDGMLYVNVYHKDGTGIVGACGSGVIGDTELYQFCLPSGKCSFYTSSTAGPNKTVLGGGILGTGLGQGVSNKQGETGLIVKKADNFCDDEKNKNKPECQLFDTGAKLQHLRWYESR